MESLYINIISHTWITIYTFKFLRKSLQQLMGYLKFNMKDLKLIKGSISLIGIQHAWPKMNVEKAWEAWIFLIHPWVPNWLRRCIRIWTNLFVNWWMLNILILKIQIESWSFPMLLLGHLSRSIFGIVGISLLNTLHGILVMGKKPYFGETLGMGINHWTVSSRMEIRWTIWNSLAICANTSRKDGVLL